MRPSIYLQLLAAYGASQVDAFWRMNCGIIQTGRVDPVISYNKVSSHVHKISGASSININSSADTLLASSCTSCQIQGDKSAYWTPGFYYYHNDGTYEEVPNSGMTVYYLGRGEEGGNEIKPFPKGLKLFSGNNSARIFDSTTLTVPGGRAIAERVNFACVNYDNPGPETYGITNIDCPQGFRAQVHFQSCWDGKNLYLSDQSHVAYLSQIDNGVCPETHPVLLPHLFYEVNYSMDKIDTSLGGKYGFANGDTTGYGFHGDFMNGWDDQLLTDGIEQCMAHDKIPSGDIDDCEPFKPTNSPDAMRRCTERSPVFPCEPVHGKINVLPGCTISSGSITCSASNQPTCAADYNPLGLTAYLGSDSFSHIGCYTEATDAKALQGKTYTDQNAMTVENCLTFCKDFKYAGVEYGQECYCGNSLATGAVLTDVDTCDMACTGNIYQTCGAGRLLNVYQAKDGPSASALPSSSSTLSTKTSSTSATASPSSSSTLSTKTSSTSATASPSATGILANFVSLGCWTEATGRALNSAYLPSDSMTRELCASYCTSENLPLFGLEYGRECWCGAYLRQGSTKAADSDCSFACAGDQTSKCGAGSLLNVYSTLDYEAPSIPSVLEVLSTGLSYNYWGCWLDGLPAPGPNRALSGKTKTDSTMTLEKCGEFCVDYKFFGIEYGGECYCDNAIAAASLKKADTECSMVCPGNYKQLACGDASRLSVYQRT